jgi:hypothetical protein
LNFFKEQCRGATDKNKKDEEERWVFWEAHSCLFPVNTCLLLCGDVIVVAWLVKTCLLCLLLLGVVLVWCCCSVHFVFMLSRRYTHADMTERCHLAPFWAETHHVTSAATKRELAQYYRQDDRYNFELLILSTLQSPQQYLLTIVVMYSSDHRPGWHIFW